MNKKLLLSTLLILSLNTMAADKSTISCENCNVIMIALDGTQAAYLGHLGHGVTPNLDSFAKKGVSFSNAISPASWTVPTYLSVFSSTYPSQHGLVNRYVEFNKDKKTLDNFTTRKPDLQVIAQILKDRGYATGGFTGDAGLGQVLGYNKGFDIYVDDRRFGGLDYTIDKFLDWLPKDGKKPFFAFVHGYDSHAQYKLPEGFINKVKDVDAETLKELSPEKQGVLREEGLINGTTNISEVKKKAWRSWYKAKVTDTDARFGHLMEEIEKRGLLTNLIVVIFSDHGTEFFEHGRVDHGHTLYDELVRVPFMMYVPKMKAQKENVKTQVSTIDILPTVLDVLKLPVDKNLEKQMAGRKLTKILSGQTLPSKDVFTETDYRNAVHKRGMRTADNWKYIISLDTGSEELYKLTSDPQELVNLATKKENRKKRDELRTKLFAHMKNDLGTVFGEVKFGTDCLPAYPDQCL